MNLSVSDTELRLIISGYNILKSKYPSITGSVTLGGLKSVISYLNDNSLGVNENYVWDFIANCNVYGYSVYVHEYCEVRTIKGLIENGDIKSVREGVTQRRTEVHGKALFKQYKIIQRYLEKTREVRKDISLICYCDTLREEPYFYEKRNAKILNKYLKKYEEIWYNKVTKYPWQDDRSLKSLLKTIREE